MPFIAAIVRSEEITLARIALIPFFVIFATIGGTTCDVIALVLFCVCSFTDFLDGYVARKYHQVTDFGKFVDPLADKLLCVRGNCDCEVDQMVLPFPVQIKDF